MDNLEQMLQQSEGLGYCINSDKKENFYIPSFKKKTKRNRIWHVKADPLWSFNKGFGISAHFLKEYEFNHPTLGLGIKVVFDRKNLRDSKRTIPGVFWVTSLYVKACPVMMTKGHQLHIVQGDSLTKMTAEMLKGGKE